MSAMSHSILALTPQPLSMEIPPGIVAMWHCGTVRVAVAMPAVLCTAVAAVAVAVVMKIDHSFHFKHSTMTITYYYICDTLYIVWFGDLLCLCLCNQRLFCVPGFPINR